VSNVTLNDLHSIHCIFFSGQATSRTFDAPGKQGTQVKYATEELRLISLVLRCLKANNYKIYSRRDFAASESTHHSQDRVYQITLSESQRRAAEALLSLLDSDLIHTSPGMARGIDDFLETIYMPDNTFASFKDTFVSPMVAFMCIRSVHDSGGFRHPKNITCELVGIQYSLRLLLLFHVQGLWDKMATTATDEELVGQDWFQ
jgi:hypothetical protein